MVIIYVKVILSESAAAMYFYVKKLPSKAGCLYNDMPSEDKRISPEHYLTLPKIAEDHPKLAEYY